MVIESGSFVETKCNRPCWGFLRRLINSVLCNTRTLRETFTRYTVTDPFYIYHIYIKLY